MNEITAIDHVGIRVFNLDLARAFYEKLGFIFITGPVGPEPVAIMRHPCGIVINFILNAVESPRKNILMDIDEKHAGYTHIALHVTDLNAIQSTLNTLDIVITEGPIHFGENFGSSLFIRDQDNNVIEFHQNA
ncbi:MAG: VOC family protein [Mariprofundaceae bacterium]|nr:VOC family protein [Mariprofundaceae bacterium]